MWIYILTAFASPPNTCDIRTAFIISQLGYMFNCHFLSHLRYKRCSSGIRAELKPTKKWDRPRRLRFRILIFNFGC